MKKYMGCIFLILWSLHSVAAVPAKKKGQQPGRSQILAGQGAVVGGLSGSGFTMIDLRRTANSKKKIERIVIDVGDLKGLPVKGWPGYYHAELQKNPQRLVIDFSQMPSSKIDEKSIASRFKGSLAVKRSGMSLDPVDNTLNLTLDLKPKTRAKVYQVAGNKSTSKVVIDLYSE